MGNALSDAPSVGVSVNRVCNQCGVSYPLSVEHFYVNWLSPHGFRTKCKECIKANRKQKYKSAKLVLSSLPKYNVAPPTKVCTKCGIEKIRSSNEFYRIPSGGLRPECKSCCIARSNTDKNKKLRRILTYASNEEKSVWDIVLNCQYSMSDITSEFDGRYYDTSYKIPVDKLSLYLSITKVKIKYIRKRCSGCANLYTRTEKAKLSNASKQHRFRLKARGLTQEDYNSMYKEQGGLCRISGEVPSLTGKSKKLVMDHDHETGFFRGLIQSRYNVILGLASDDPEILEKCAAYLRDAKRRYEEKLATSNLVEFQPNIEQAG